MKNQTAVCHSVFCFVVFFAAIDQGLFFYGSSRSHGKQDFLPRTIVGGSYERA